MKKIILGITAIGLCVALAGCGNSAKDSTITDLSHQLDETANTINNVQTVKPTDINITASALDSIATKNNNIRSSMTNTQNTLSAEEQYKMEILDRTELLKKGLSKNLRLSKAQCNAMKELTSNLNRYTNSVAYTRNDLSKTVKDISSLKKNGEKNADKLNAKLNRLACNSNARATFYENILNTLDQLETYVDCDNCKNGESEQGSQIKNNGPIYTLPKNDAQDENANVNFTVMPYNSNNFNRMNGYGYGNGMPYGYGNYSNGMYGNNLGFGNRFRRNGYYGNGNNYGFGYYGNGNNEMFNYGGHNNFGTNEYGTNGINNGMFNNRFNPNRNTDTYAPLIRNIDTYRFSADEYKNGINGFGGVVATTNPQQRLESFEEVKDDNTIENVEKDEQELKQNSEKKENQETPTEIEENADNDLSKASKNEQIQSYDLRIRKVDTRPKHSTSTPEDGQRVVAH